MMNPDSSIAVDKRRLEQLDMEALLEKIEQSINNMDDTHKTMKLIRQAILEDDRQRYIERWRGFMNGVEKAIELIQCTEEQEAGRLRNLLVEKLMELRYKEGRQLR